MRAYPFLVVPVLLLWACGSEPVSDEPVVNPDAPQGNLVQITGEAQGTTYAIQYVEADSNASSHATTIDQILGNVDKSLSLWDTTSVITQINKPYAGIGNFSDPHDLMAVVWNLSLEVYEHSGHAFDPSVYPLVNAWGFGLTNAESMTEEKVDSLRALVGFDRIVFSDVLGEDGRYALHIEKPSPEVKVDFNAVAQGYTVDVVSDFLELNGIENFIVEIGGEVRAIGMSPAGRPWRVQIDRPVEGNAHERQAVVNLENKALATSGSYRKVREVNGNKYSHTIDPFTGYPVTHNLLSVTVLADECAYADAYATAFMVLGLEKAKALMASGNLTAHGMLLHLCG